MIRKTILATLFATFAVSGIMAQKPRMMVLPDKTWCISKNYVDIIERNGKERKVENYDKAFADKDLTQIAATLKSIFTAPGREFPLLSYNEVMEADEDDDAIDDAFEGAESGSGVSSNAFEVLMAKKSNTPDIYLKVGWNEEQVGLQKVLAYRLDAIDSYSRKSVATIEGTTVPMPKVTPISTMLSGGIKDKFAEFENKLINHFADLQANGREINLRIRIIDNGSGLTFNKEYGDKELRTMITDWMTANTVGHSYTTKNSTRTQLVFSDVRIPFKKPDGKQNNAESFATQFQNFLKGLGLPAENASGGLGDGRIYIGEK